MDPDFRKRSPEQKGREGREGREASSVEDGDLVAHPFWSERARAEVDLMRARPADLDLQGEVRVDEEEIHPSYENTSDLLLGQSKGRPITSERPRELARIQEVEVISGEEGTRVSSSQPPDLLSMSPEKPEASSQTKRESPKPSLEPSDVGPAGQQREMSSMLAGVQNLSGSGALDSEVGGSSRAVRRSALETSEDVGAQEVSSTTVESVSDGKVLNTSHSFCGEASGSVGVRVGRAEGASEGTAKRSIPLSPEAQGSLKGLAYEISDPSDQYFEIARLRSMVEHLHDRLEKAETERSTRGAAISPSEVPGVDFGLQSSLGHSYATHQSGPPNARFTSGPPNAHCVSGPPNALMIEDGTMDFVSPPAEVPSMDFGLQRSASAGAQYFALSPRAQLPVSSGHIVVMGVNHKWRIVNGSLVLEPVEAVPPPPPGYPSLSVAAPPHVAWSMCPKGPPAHQCHGSSPPPRHLSVAGMIFRLMTVFQPGGFEAAPWAQWRMRLTQLQAAEPDTTLLVKGLDTLTQKALAKHPSSLFRLATFRERLGIDYAPTSEAVSELCHMLQAEVEHLSHSGADEGPQKEDADNKRQKLQKVLSPAAPKPSSPVHPSAKASGAKPCKNWLTAGGCSYGNSCQFFHDQSEEKMKGRCFSCSAEDHWADTCPVKARLKAEAKAAAEESPSGNPKSPKSSSDGSPKGKGKGKKEGKGKGDKQVAKPKVRAADPQKPPPSSEEQPSPGIPNADNSTAAINAEILNVLRSIKTKSFRVRVVNDETGYGLLDSGASAALRQGTQQEIDSSIPVTVSLAVGEMVMFRNDSGTLLVREAVQPIVPMSALPLLVCEISWSDRGCFVRHPSQGLLPVRLRDGTPELPANLVLRLIAEYERFLLRHQAARDTSARVWQHALGKDDVSLGSLREWLSKHLRDDSCGELELQTVSKVLFPDLPEALASQVATSPSFDPSRVPFNRRTRRQLFDPQVPTMVHLFAGQHRWRNSVGQVLEVDAAKGADLLSDDVFGMLLRAATSGAIDGVVVAPPCKTFDPDASAPSSGGMTFRGEEGEERFGHQGLSHADQALVDRDTLLFLRSLLLIFVAACAKEKVFTCLEMPEASYAWEWPECENVTVSLGGWTAGFDQGALGSANHKSSAVYTSSFQLYEALHEVRVAPENGDSRTSDFSDKGWAPGLVSRILRAWENYCYLSFEKIQALTREREGLLLNLCQEAVAAKMSPEVWERHCQADHIPYRNDCAVCIQGASRDRSHHSKNPHLFELTSDVAGPYHKGRDFGGKCRYFVVFTIRVPVKSDQADWVEKSAEIVSQEEQADKDAQAKEDPHSSLVYAPVQITGEPLRGSVESPSRVSAFVKLGDDFLEGGSSAPAEPEVSAAVPLEFNSKNPQRPPPLSSEPDASGCSFVTLSWAEPLRTRQAFAMQLAVMRAVAHLRAHGIPCFRFHSDRAREFLGDALERFLAEQGIFSTRTAPEDHAANGASEVAIRELKRAARKALLASNLDSSHWPTAIRHVGEVAWRRTEKAEAQGCVDLSYKESLESEAESLDFLQDPQQESLSFQEARMASVEEFSDSEASATLRCPGETHPRDSSDDVDKGLRASGEDNSVAKVAKFVGPNPQRLPEPRPRPNRRRQATLYVSFGYFEPEQWRALCTLEEEEFERQLVHFVQMLDPSDAVNDDTEIPFALFRATLQNHQWRSQPVIMVTDLQGQPEPLLEVLQHHDDDYSMYEEGMQFPDRLLVFTIWNFRLGRTQVVLLRITEARDEQNAEPVLRVPGPEPPAVMKLRIKAFRPSRFLDGCGFRIDGHLEFRTLNPLFLTLGFERHYAVLTDEEVLKAITMYVKQKDAVNRISKRPIAGSYRESTSEAALPPWFWSSGAWVFSGKVGVTKTVATCPWFTRLLVTALSRQTPQSFATIAFLVNIEMEVHKDSHNDASSMNLAWNVGQGGGSLEVSGHRIALPPGAWVSFPPREFHKSGPWDGNKVLVLGYTPRSLEKLTSSELLSLRWVGMPFDHSLPSDSPLLAAIDCESGDEEMILPSEMSWDQVGQDFEHMHHCVTFFLKTLQRSVVGSSSEGPVDPITLQAMREAAALRKELEWHLELARLQGCEVPVSSSVWRVCAAAPAAEHLESQPILHTRIVSNEEVREKLHEWRDAMKAECDSLISKGAVELVADGQVDQWIAEGKDVEILPGRGVATEKPPTSPGATKRNKYRAVICGNFQKWSEERASESFYAGGSGTDIKTAFLNAPLDEGEAEKRDRTCRTLTWFTGECSRHLQQCVSDPNIWLVKSSQDEILALVCWYVDDLLVLGPWEERISFLEKIKATWERSAFSHTEEGTVEYCGLEISESAEGLLIGQQKYISELLKRHDVQGSAKSPCASWASEYDDAESREDSVDPEAVKAAQSLTGELLWLSVRARPELSFPVSRMAQLTTKRPKDALGIGLSWRPPFMLLLMRLLDPAQGVLTKDSLCVGLGLLSTGNQGVRPSPRSPLRKVS
ncbi:hypothetical protein AK812_SmicGene22530 [Symbiodinium microadriaticum]|uniref:C3H1-type domain-containing protein n=1 Tax=Symbiodinium microadriaticum TaxID=2951 RepID=A0A1Q9DJJ6_SYMMI|nr:hypothetical protein AK812_SmicGene22530 [Symbiodinium microadriaticum]